MRNTKNFLNKIEDSLKKKVDEYEIFYINNQETPVIFESDKLKSLNSKFTSGVGLRIVKEGKIGFSSLSSEREEYIGKLVENAISSCRFGLKKEFEFPKNKKIPKLYIYDKKIVDLKIEKMIEIGNQAIEIVKNSNKKVRTSLQIEKNFFLIRIINSSGLDLSYKKSIFTFFITSILVQKNDLLEVTEEFVSSSLLNFDLKKITENLLKKINLAKKIDSIPTKRIPVIFSPRAMSSVIMPLQRMINGKFVQKNSSPLVGKIGEKIFDKRLTIYDDGTLNFALNSSPVDDEGTIRGKFPIIENGILKNFVLDLQTAGMLKMKSTGNATRGLTSPPFPDTSNIVIEEGKESLENIIKSVKEGLIVEQTMGSHQANLLSGEFSFNVDLGFKIKNGEISGRVKDVMITGNIFETFNQIISISKEREIIFGNLLSPYFYIDRVSVSSK
jgi:PmbA protein